MNSKSLTVPIILITVVIQAFLLVNGETIFGSSWSAYEPALVTYVLLDSLFLALALSKVIPFAEISIWDAIPVFAVTFLISGYLLQALFRVAPITISVNNFIIDFIFQIFVVAFTEEMLFRGILLQYTGPIIQGILFGLFHVTSYYMITGIDWSAILVAIVMGILFGYIVQYFQKMHLSGTGLTITWAIHSAWNISLTTSLFALMIVPTYFSLNYITVSILLFMIIFVIVLKHKTSYED